MSDATTAQAIKAVASYYSTPIGIVPVIAYIDQKWEKKGDGSI